MKNKFTILKIFITMPLLIVLPIIFMNQFLNINYSNQMIIKTTIWSYFYFVVFDVIIKRFSYIKTSKFDVILLSKTSLQRLNLIETLSSMITYIPGLIVLYSLLLYFEINIKNINFLLIFTLLFILIYIINLLFLGISLFQKNTFNILNLMMDLIYIAACILYPMSFFNKYVQFIFSLLPISELFKIIDGNINFLNFIIMSIVWYVVSLKLIEKNIKIKVGRNNV